MEKFVRWTCFITSGCMVVLFILALYISTLLPDTFSTVEGDAISIAGMPFLRAKPKDGDAPVAQIARGSSYNAELALGGVIPVKTVRTQVVSRRTVQVCGTPFGIKMFANGAMVVGFTDIYTVTGYQNPAKNAGIKMGDVIQSIAGKSTKTNDDVKIALQKIGGNPAEIIFLRNGVQKHAVLTAVRDENGGGWRTGMWVRDSSAGIGTLTFVDPANSIFAGLGHSIHDVDTGSTISLRKGEIVDVEITGYIKGAQGSPGELKGQFISAVPTGVITANGETGVYGNTTSAFSGELMDVALAQEIQPGPAEIITTIEGKTPKRYTVQIEKIALNAENQNRNMIVRVTDKRLLAATGGIVQGMSGSPLVQNGHFIGAVTHVLVNDPTRGYAIFAENMLKTADLTSVQKAA